MDAVMRHNPVRKLCAVSVDSASPEIDTSHRHIFSCPVFREAGPDRAEERSASPLHAPGLLAARTPFDSIWPLRYNEAVEIVKQRYLRKIQPLLKKVEQ